jgi:glutathione S-transferase
MSNVSYYSKLPLIAAMEKQIRYKAYPMDIIRKKEQFEPWFLHLNPKNTVPVMLVGESNEVVLESLD